MHERESALRKWCSEITHVSHISLEVSFHVAACRLLGSECPLENPRYNSQGAILARLIYQGWHSTTSAVVAPEVVGDSLVGVSTDNFIPMALLFFFHDFLWNSLLLMQGLNASRHRLHCVDGFHHDRYGQACSLQQWRLKSAFSTISKLHSQVVILGTG